MRIISLLLPVLLAGCAGYALDYTKPRSEIIGPQLARFGLDQAQQTCMTARLGETLSVWQTRQLEIVAGSITNGFYEFNRLTPADLAWAARNTKNKSVGPEFDRAAAACNVATAPPMRVAAATATPSAGTSAAAAPPVAAAAAATWINLGAAATGQAIAIDSASVAPTGPRQAWFRITNPGQAEASPVAYLLRMDCQARTINPMAARRQEAGQVAEQRDYGPNGEGALPIEAGTVMELAWRSLCG